MSSESAIWHDLECGSYRADLPYWRALARRHGGPVLDIGAGTGRVALALARDGHAVIALERERELALELGARAGRLRVEVRCADACAFELRSPVPLCIVPMQTLHLLADRAAFLRCARAALLAGGLLAVALLGAGVEPFELELEPDSVLLDGVRYESAPTALRRLPAAAPDVAGTVVIERRRSRVPAQEEPRSELDSISLRECDAATLADEAGEAGFALLGVHALFPTRDHAGSEIVSLEALP